MYATTDAILWDRMEDACGGLVGQSELRAAALLKAVWWDLRLASLLTHLFVFYGYGFLSGGKR